MVRLIVRRMVRLMVQLIIYCTETPPLYLEMITDKQLTDKIDRVLIGEEYNKKIQATVDEGDMDNIMERAAAQARDEVGKAAGKPPPAKKQKQDPTSPEKAREQPLPEGIYCFNLCFLAG